MFHSVIYKNIYVSDLAQLYNNAQPLCCAAESFSASFEFLNCSDKFVRDADVENVMDVLPVVGENDFDRQQGEAMDLDRSAHCKCQRETHHLSGEMPLGWCVSHVCCLSISSLDIEIHISTQHSHTRPTATAGKCDCDEGFHHLSLCTGFSLSSLLPCGVNGLWL